MTKLRSFCIWLKQFIAFFLKESAFTVDYFCWSLRLLQEVQFQPCTGNSITCSGEHSVWAIKLDHWIGNVIQTHFNKNTLMLILVQSSLVSVYVISWVRMLVLFRQMQEVSLFWKEKVLCVILFFCSICYDIERWGSFNVDLAKAASLGNWTVNICIL